MERKHQTGFIILFFMGIVFTVVGLAVVYYLGHDIRFSCLRPENRCVIEKTDVFGKTEVDETFPLNTLTGAEVIEISDSDGDYTYKVMLITSDGHIPLSGCSSSERKAHRLNAEKINDYVNSSEQRLEIVQSGTFPRIFGFVFAGAGVLMLLGSLGGLLKLLVLLFVMASSG